MIKDEDKDDFKFVRHPELCLGTPLSESDQHLKESSDYTTPLYEFLCRVSDSPNPLALCLFPIYLLVFNKLSLLLFLSKADPCEPFEPKTL
jgi:hypothetical protein